MKSPRTNIKRLNDEGFGIKPGLPKEYEDVIEDLRPDELEVIIDVVRRLERAQQRVPDEPFQAFFPTF
jgi:hypothetical protein